MSPRFNYFASDGNHWIRVWRWQVGFHRNGRRKTFSERQGWHQPPLTMRVGRRAEISYCTFGTQPQFEKGGVVHSPSTIWVPAGTVVNPPPQDITDGPR